MGGGAVGVEAASQFYFGKSVRDINLAESAVLAGLFKAPTKYAPHVNLPASRARTNDVLSNLVDAGYYSPGQVHAARLHPAKIVEPPVTNSPDWFLDWAFEEVQRLAEGKSQFVLTARTTIDLDMQKKADEVLTSAIRTSGRSNHFNSGALVAMETDGAVRSIVGGPDYGETQFNRATHAKRQPGSSFKIYVYATALERGMRPESPVVDAAPSCGNWHPSNYGGGGGSGGSLPAWMALAKSLNTVAVSLSLKYGRDKVIDMTRRLGIKGIRPSCSMALGDYGITPLEHTGGVATFANGGRLSKPYGILELVNSKGDLVYSRERDEPEAPQVVKRAVAEHLNWMLQKVVTEGTGNHAALDFTNAVGKTGTSTGPKDAWFVGFTGRLVAGVWIGNDDNHPMNSGVTGGHQAAPIWHDFMAVAHTNFDFPPIPGIQPHPRQIEEHQKVMAEAQNAPAGNSAPGAANANGGRTSQSLMPDATRAALKRIAEAMRNATSGVEPTSLQGAPPPASPAPAGSAAPPRPPAPPANDPPAAPRPPDRRAGLTPPEPAAQRP
jgi:penicillin-binding protein 1A